MRLHNKCPRSATAIAEADSPAAAIGFDLDQRIVSDRHLPGGMGPHITDNPRHLQFALEPGS